MAGRIVVAGDMALLLQLQAAQMQALAGNATRPAERAEIAQRFAPAALFS